VSLFKRLSAAAVAVVLGLGASLVAVAPAHAAEPLPTIVVFSNDDLTDVDQEDATLIEDLELTGALVETFDGGDGSAAAWEAALDGADVLVLPEGSAEMYDATPADTDYLTVDAHDVLFDWVSAGGYVIVSDISDETDDLLSFLTGEDFVSGWSSVGASSYDSQIAELFVPTVLYDANATNAFDISALAPDTQDIITPWYTADDAVAAAGIDGVGTGTVAFFGWDWFPDEAEADIRRDWGVLLIRFIKESFLVLTEMGVPATVDIRVELDYYPETSAGPIVFETSDVAVGDGPELTADDEIENPEDYCGSVTVDIDPVAKVIILDADEDCNFSVAKLIVTSSEIDDLALVEDELFLSESLGDDAAIDDVQAAVTVEFPEYALDWEFSDGTLAADWTVNGGSDLLLYGISVFSYAEAEEELAATGPNDALLLMSAAAAALLGGLTLLLVRRRVRTQ